MQSGGTEGATRTDSPRILLVSQPTAAGTARHVADLAEGLNAGGLDVTVACPRGGMLPDRLARAGVPLVELPMRREISPLGDVVAFFRLLRLCRRMRPDVLHAHSSKAGFLGRLAGRVAGVPVVVFTPHCWSFQSASGAKRDFYIRLERFASRFCDMTVTVSEQEALEAQELGVVSADRVRVVHNGVSSREFVGGAAGSKDIAFLSVGRLDEQKGYTYLLQAMADLRSLESNARLVIVGDGTLRQQLEREAEKLGLGEAVQFAGEQSDVGSYLRRAHVFVLSSLWEGLPYTIIEAMAARLPVVCTDVGGCRELVSDGETGTLVPPHDPSALAVAMRALWRDDSLRRSMGSAGYERARRLFRLEDCVAANERVYRDRLAAWRAGVHDVHPAALFGRRGAALLAVLVVAAAAWVGVDQVTYRERIYPGVRVGGMDVGGMTRTEAKLEADALLKRGIRVRIAEGVRDVPVSGTDLRFDVLPVLDQAFLVGRTGALPERIAKRVAATHGEVTVPLPARDEGVAADLLAGARAELDRAPVDARFEISGGALRIASEHAGARVDARGLMEALGEAATSERATNRVTRVPTTELSAAVDRGELAQIASQAERWTNQDVVGAAGAASLTLTRDRLASMLTLADGELDVSGPALADVLGELKLPFSSPTNARFDVVGGKVLIVDGKPGREVDASATALSLRDALEAGSDHFEIALKSREPDITRADLESMGITNQVSSFTTSFRLGQDGRDVNISLAAGSIRGTVLGIGEVFSLNKVTGPRNRATGYKEALVFSHGKVVPGIGGGVCQVSSTTYQAALRAGLRIVERRSHSMAVTYLAPGLDATTYYPSVDLKFQNTTRGPLLVWTAVKGNKLTVSIYGTVQRPDVRIKTVLRKTMEPRRKMVYVRTLPHNVQVIEEVGRPGYVVTSYRLIYKAGSVARREELATDEYQPRDWVIRVGI